jgi:hypothetical protein
MTPAYGDLVPNVWYTGARVPSRHGPTAEKLGVQVRFRAGETVRRPGVNRALGYMELMQLIGGVFDPAALRRVAPRADHSLFTPQMAYGPRVADQVPRTIMALQRDPLTRQAVVFVGGVADGPTPNLPCTETIQFVIRDSSLHAVVSMRSWDLVKGLTYDVVMFGGLTLTVAACLGYRAGVVTVTAGSAHVYQADWFNLSGKSWDVPGPRRFDWTVEAINEWGPDLLDVDPLRMWDRATDMARRVVTDETWTKGAPGCLVEAK